MAKKAQDLKTVFFVLSILGYVFSSSLVFAQEQLPPSSKADLLLVNGKIHADTDSGSIVVQALSIRNGVIASVGSTKALEKEKGDQTKIIDLKGKSVYPGFNDAHLHLTQGGLSLSQVSLTGLSTVADFQKKIKEYAAANPGKKWILGGGWDHTALPKQKYPTRAELDEALADRPMFLWHTDHHLALVNSKAIEELKLAADHSGLLLESDAVLASSKAEKYSKEELVEAFQKAAQYLLENGITSVQGTTWQGDENGEVLIQELQTIQENFSKNKQTFRYSVWGQLTELDEFIKIKEKFKDLPKDWVKIDTLKGYVDGVISAHTAAMLEPYNDEKNIKGTPNYTQEKLNELVLKANRAGFTVALHAVGDRAVGMSILAFANAKKHLFNSRIRNRIEHVEVMPVHAFQKFYDLGIVASVQPSHFIYDNESQNYNEQRLGKERVKNAFAFRGLLNSRAHLAFGSDWPVMPANPMIGLFGAVHRQHFNFKPSSGWLPSQKLRIKEAVDAYTLGGAYATREDHLKGTIREGKLADLVVLTNDLEKVNAKDLLKTKPVYTIVGGKIVYDGNIPQLKAM